LYYAEFLDFLYENPKHVAELFKKIIFSLDVILTVHRR